MVITVDLPEELVTRIDALITKRPEPPVWPFAKRYVKASKLSIKDRKKLEDYQAALKAYNEYVIMIKPERGSRSAIVEDLLRGALNLPIVIAEETTNQQEPTNGAN